MRKSKMGLVYILPWLIGMVFLTLYPFINALVISFTDYNLVREPNFIGLANYTKLFQDEDFLGTLTATLKYTVITVPLQLAFALFIAYILNFKLKGINFSGQPTIFRPCWEEMWRWRCCGDSCFSRTGLSTVSLALSGYSRWHGSLPRAGR